MQENGFMKEIIDYLKGPALYESILIIIIASILLWVIKKYLIKKVAYSGKSEQHLNTFIGMIFNVMQYLVMLASIFLILQVNGVNVGGMLAGLGIVATIIGLSLQDTLKDIFSGINIYNNNFYKVGDMVRWNGEECDVKYFSARVTKFRSILTNSTYTVCNSSINSIEKIKDTRFKSFRFKFDEERAIVDKAFENIAKVMKEDCKDLKDIKYLGPIDMTYEGVEFAILYFCPAHKNLDIYMHLIDVAYNEFKKAGIMPDQNSFSVDTTMIN